MREMAQAPIAIGPNGKKGFCVLFRISGVRFNIIVDFHVVMLG